MTRSGPPYPSREPQGGPHRASSRGRGGAPSRSCGQAHERRALQPPTKAAAPGPEVPGPGVPPPPELHPPRDPSRPCRGPPGTETNEEPYFGPSDPQPCPACQIGGHSPFSSPSPSGVTVHARPFPFAPSRHPGICLLTGAEPPMPNAGSPLLTALQGLTRSQLHVTGESPFPWGRSRPRSREPRWVAHGEP